MCTELRKSTKRNQGAWPAQTDFRSSLREKIWKYTQEIVKCKFFGK